MTRDTNPTTIDEFRVALDNLLVLAHENGIDLANRPYALRHEESALPDWEVHIIQLAKQHTS